MSTPKLSSIPILGVIFYALGTLSALKALFALPAGNFPLHVKLDVLFSAGVQAAFLFGAGHVMFYLAEIAYYARELTRTDRKPGN